MLELTEDDIPGAELDEPLESHAVHALRRRLLLVVARHTLQTLDTGQAQGIGIIPPPASACTLVPALITHFLLHCNSTTVDRSRMGLHLHH